LRALFLCLCKLQEPADIKRSVAFEAAALLEFARLHLDGIQAAVFFLLAVTPSIWTFLLIVCNLLFNWVQKVRVALAPFENAKLSDFFARL
jgi:hypothetical protein